MAEESIKAASTMTIKMEISLFFALQFLAHFGAAYGFTISLMNDSEVFPAIEGYDGHSRILEHFIANALVIQRLGRKSVCYGQLGCFHVVGRFSHFRRVPDPPERLASRFLLCTRHKPDCDAGETLGSVGIEPTPQLSERAILLSGLDLVLPTKVIVHGYSGKHTNTGVKRIKTAFLKKEDCNVIVVDWAIAARGPSYLRAVANAELVGRQISMILGTLVALGANAKDMHIIGFSLGAQIAGFAGEDLKHQGIKLGRITALDPASFMFERSNLDTRRKLDISDAELVDVVHTDGSLVWSDGFGTLGAVGHVDFFPNGGLAQPGCSDSYVDALAFSLDPQPNSNRSCSHARSLDLFLEAMQSDCKFVGFACPGLKNFDRHFIHGNCFSCDSGSCAVLGDVWDVPEGSPMAHGRGPLYLMTRDSKPYCGQQVRAYVTLSHRTLVTRGYLQLILHHGNTSTSFELNSKLYPLGPIEALHGGRDASSIEVLKSGSLSAMKTPTLTATILFKPSFGLRRYNTDLYFDRVTITSQEGETWYYCGKDTLLEEKNGETYGRVNLKLVMNPC